MTKPERATGLEALSAEDKDRVILNLWEELKAERAETLALKQRVAALEAQTPQDGPGARSLFESLREASPGKGASPAARDVEIKLGRGLGLLRSKVVIGAIALAAVLLLLDQGIGWYQQRRLEAERLAELRLERAAYTGLFVEVIKVAYEPDGKSYRLTMNMQNLEPQQPLYVMLSPVRVFEQSGLVWKEVPAHATAGQASGVVKLTDRHTYETVFEPNIKDWTELIPGYMHIRLDNNMLISRRSEPDEDIVERNDPYYVYLKPHDADNEKISKAMNHQGEPPIYMPMPPH